MCDVTIYIINMDSYETIYVCICIHVIGKGIAAMFALAVASYQSLYPFMLVIPLSVYLCRDVKVSAIKFKRYTSTLSYLILGYPYSLPILTL